MTKAEFSINVASESDNSRNRDKEKQTLVHQGDDQKLYKLDLAASSPRNHIKFRPSKAAHATSSDIKALRLRNIKNKANNVSPFKSST